MRHKKKSTTCCVMQVIGTDEDYIISYNYIRKYYFIYLSMYKLFALFSSKHAKTIRILAAINPLTAKLFNLNFHPLEVVSR